MGTDFNSAGYKQNRYVNEQIYIKDTDLSRHQEHDNLVGQQFPVQHY